MKSLKDISWQVSEETYRADKALSYSTLAKYERGEGFNSIPTLFEKVTSPSLLFGSVVDTLMLGEEGEFDSKFVVTELPELSDSLKDIAEMLVVNFCPNNVLFKDIPDSAIAKIGETCGYYAAPKYENYRIKLIRQNCESYYNAKSLVKDKQLVSTKDYNDAQACCQALKSSPATSKYFIDDPFNDIEVYFQLKFKFEVYGVPYRSMLDIIMVDHKNKIIYPCDLKTSSHYEWEFFKSFVEWRYDIQACLYASNLKYNILKDDFYKHYKVADYTFIVVNRKSLTPLAWTFPFTHSTVGWSYTRPSGMKMVFRDPCTIGKELWTYLTKGSKLPKDIQEKGINNIVEFLESR